MDANERELAEERKTFYAKPSDHETVNFTGDAQTLGSARFYSRFFAFIRG
jgi:hypothetical protein